MFVYNEYCTLPSQRGAHGHQISPPNLNNISNNTSGSKQSTNNFQPSNHSNTLNSKIMSQTLPKSHLRQIQTQIPTQKPKNNMPKNNQPYIDETRLTDFQEFTIDDELGIPDSGTHNSMSSTSNGTERSLELEQLFHSPQPDKNIKKQQQDVPRKMLVNANSDLTRDIQELRSKFDAISRGEKINPSESINFL